MTPAALSAAHSCNSESSTANAQACQSAKAAIVGASIGAIGVIVSFIGWKLGATHFSREVKEMDQKLLKRYSRILQSREDAGERFSQGKPNVENLVSRYTKLTKKDRNRINTILDDLDIGAVSADAADNV